MEEPPPREDYLAILKDELERAVARSSEPEDIELLQNVLKTLPDSEGSSSITVECLRELNFFVNSSSFDLRLFLDDVPDEDGTSFSTRGGGGAVHVPVEELIRREFGMIPAIFAALASPASITEEVLVFTEEGKEMVYTAMLYIIRCCLFLTGSYTAEPTLLNTCIHIGRLLARASAVARVGGTEQRRNYDIALQSLANLDMRGTRDLNPLVAALRQIPELSDVLLQSIPEFSCKYNCEMLLHTVLTLYYETARVGGRADLEGFVQGIQRNVVGLIKHPSRFEHAPIYSILGRFLGQGLLAIGDERFTGSVLKRLAAFIAEFDAHAGLPAADQSVQQARQHVLQRVAFVVLGAMNAAQEDRKFLKAALDMLIAWHSDGIATLDRSARTHLATICGTSSDMGIFTTVVDRYVSALQKAAMSASSESTGDFVGLMKDFSEFTRIVCDSTVEDKEDKVGGLDRKMQFVSVKLMRLFVEAGTLVAGLKNSKSRGEIHGRLNAIAPVLAESIRWYRPDEAATPGGGDVELFQEFWFTAVYHGYIYGSTTTTSTSQVVDPASYPPGLTWPNAGFSTMLAAVARASPILVKRQDRMQTSAGSFALFKQQSETRLRAAIEGIIRAPVQLAESSKDEHIASTAVVCTSALPMIAKMDPSQCLWLLSFYMCELLGSRGNDTKATSTGGRIAGSAATLVEYVENDLVKSFNLQPLVIALAEVIMSSWMRAAHLIPDNRSHLCWRSTFEAFLARVGSVDGALCDFAGRHVRRMLAGSKSAKVLLSETALWKAIREKQAELKRIAQGTIKYDVVQRDDRLPLIDPSHAERCADEFDRVAKRALDLSSAIRPSFFPLFIKDESDAASVSERSPLLLTTSTAAASVEIPNVDALWMSEVDFHKAPSHDLYLSIAALIHHEGGDRREEALKYVVHAPFMYHGLARTANRVWSTLVYKTPSLLLQLLMHVQDALGNLQIAHNSVFTEPSRNSLALSRHPSITDAELRHEGRLRAGIDDMLVHIDFLRDFSMHLRSSSATSTADVENDIIGVLARLCVTLLDSLAQGDFQPTARVLLFASLQLGLNLGDDDSPSSGARLHPALIDRMYTALWRYYEHTREATAFSEEGRQRALMEIARMEDVFGRLFTSTLPKRSTLKAERVAIVRRLVRHDIYRLSIWNGEESKAKEFAATDSAPFPPPLLSWAFGESRRMAHRLTERFFYADMPGLLASEYARLPAASFTRDPVSTDEVERLVACGVDIRASSTLTAAFASGLVNCAAVSPLTALSIFQNPRYSGFAPMLALARRSLEAASPPCLLFYIPQIVQALQWDNNKAGKDNNDNNPDRGGVVRQAIMTIAKGSSLVAHQIIWNLKANMYERPAYGQVTKAAQDGHKRTVALFTSAIRDIEASLQEVGEIDFYRREFAFFDRITSISGALRAYVKKEKWEKKRVIDAELKRVVVDPGVYLPSNPACIVVDIDYASGRPLQSHAKTPFMATFMVQQRSTDDIDDRSEDTNGRDAITKQAAIFKVGDDCRQDVLTLQLLTAIRTILDRAGLDLHIFPYRVVATSPDCGMIEVIPRSISRDMLGREHINSLPQYFSARFGHVQSPGHQRARKNFIKSMAAYSIACYLVQIKDRHNGNIMIDEDGNIIHIDFGYVLGMTPRGWLESSIPFKLTTEMLQVIMGDTAEAYTPSVTIATPLSATAPEDSGISVHTPAPISNESESPFYRWFEELCVRGFLACRPHARTLQSIVGLMEDSGLPCFESRGDYPVQGHPASRSIYDKLCCDLSEAKARHAMRRFVYESSKNLRTYGYDVFQAFQNNIPH